MGPHRVSVDSEKHKQFDGQQLPIMHVQTKHLVCVLELPWQQAVLTSITAFNSKGVAQTDVQPSWPIGEGTLLAMS